MHLWYFVATIVATILLYIVVNKISISDRGIMVVATFLYFVGVLGNAYFNNWMKSQNNNIFGLYYKLFFTTRNGFFFGFPLMVIGYLIAKNKHRIKKRNYGVGVVFFLIAMTIEVFIIHHYFMLNVIDMTFMLAPTVLYLFLFIAFMKCNNKNAYNYAVHFRKLSLLVYGIHLFVKFYYGLIFKSEEMHNSLLEFGIVLFVTLLISEIVLFFAEKKHSKILRALI